MTHRWLKFWPQDWQSDASLRVCSLAARGMWMEMLCLMHNGTPYGHLTVGEASVSTRQLGMITGSGEKEAVKLIRELEEAGVFSRTDAGIIFSRRMVRDWDYELKHKNYGRSGGNPDLVRAPNGTVPKSERVTRLKPDKNPRLFRQVFEEAGGKCALCGTALTRETPYAPNSYQLDHIIQIKDGGTNDRDNLRAVCRKCNMARNFLSPSDVEDNPNTDDPVKGSSDDPVKPPTDDRDKFLEARSKKLEARSERERSACASAPAARPPKAKIPEGWFPNDAGIRFAREAGISDVAEIIGQFTDYYVANGTPKADWDAAWNVWVSREQTFNPARRNGK